MTDDLDDLKAAMTAATPAPDKARRQANLAMAQKNFDALQGSKVGARQTSVNGQNALWTGVKTMLNSLTSKGALTASTALVACGFLFLTPTGQNLIRKPAPVLGATDLNNSRSLQEKLAATPEAFTTPAPARAENEVQFDADELMAAPAPAGRVIASPQATASDGVALAASELYVADDIIVEMPGTETYANAQPNAVKIVTDDPVSTFSIDVDTASYSLVRSDLNRGYMPNPDAVRVEELINYFPYDYATPEAGEAPFRPTVSVMPTPWNAGTNLVHIAVQGRMPAVADRPALNLVFLIDTSGSMSDANKLPLLKQSFRLMLDQLRPQDEIAIVEYAGSAGQVLAPTPASDRTTILQAIGSLGAGGSTNGQGGLEQAYAVAQTMAGDGEVNRVILATDGDFNVGINDPEALKSFIADKRDSGAYLSVLGFGRGNLDDATMQALAQNGNGIASYIDTLSEAQKVLVDQLSGALFPIAGDVKVQVEFNPAQVSEYRLIGYETRSLRREDFNNDKVDAGELGAGHNVTAIYEVTYVGSDAELNDPLRYGDTVAPDDLGELGFLKLRYKEPGESTSKLISLPITGDEAASGEAQFAAAIAGFGQLLRGSDYLGDWSYGNAIDLANANRGDDPFGYRMEAVQLMRLAQSISGN